MTDKDDGSNDNVLWLKRWKRTANLLPPLICAGWICDALGVLARLRVDCWQARTLKNENVFRQGLPHLLGVFPEQTYAKRRLNVGFASSTQDSSAYTMYVHYSTVLISPKTHFAQAKGDAMETPKRVIRALIADDHPVTRQDIRAILEEAPGIEVVGEAKDGVETKQMVAELDPDILLLDLVMPGLPVYEVEAWVRANCPATVTLVLTGHDRDYYLTKALEAKITGFLTWDSDL